MSMRNQNSATVDQVLRILNELAPPELAEEWDKIGLQVGDPGQIVHRALLTLDVTSSVVDCAAADGSQLIISHHPLIFSPLITIRRDVPEQLLLDEIIRRRISLIIAHTNLDAAAGGVADCLLDTLQPESGERRPIAAFGRLMVLAEPELLSRLRERIHRLLGSCGCRINTDQDRLVRRLAVFPGSFAEDTIPELAGAGVDALVCGEIKHHQGLMLAARGIAAIDAGHDVTERVVLAPLARKLAGLLPQISFAVSGGLDYNKMAF